MTDRLTVQADFSRKCYSGMCTRMGVMSSSRSAGRAIPECRHNISHTRLTSVEAFLRWSLTRDTLMASSMISFIIFTVIEEAVHVTLTQTHEDDLEMHQWIFAPETTLDEVCMELFKELHPGTRCYLFTSGYSTLCRMPSSHLGSSLTTAMLKQHFPGSSVIHLECLARLASRFFPRFLGSDTRHWLRKLMQSSSLLCGDSAAQDLLLSAASTDSAMILRLLVTPADNFRQALQKCS